MVARLVFKASSITARWSGLLLISSVFALQANAGGVPTYSGEGGTEGASPAIDLAAANRIDPSSDRVDLINSGIEGQLVIAPVKPLEDGETSNRRAYVGIVTVLDDKGQTVTELQSDANGRFRIALKPGTYTLQPRFRGVYARAAKQTVRVAAGEFIRVTIAYDSGIR